jgi:hypothetical protein
MVPKKKTETRETAERVPLPIGLIVPPWDDKTHPTTR